MSLLLDDCFCSELSRQVHEPMHGTAVTAHVWFLLEYNGPWRARATEDNDLPPRVQAWLEAQQMAVGDARVQFIKQETARETTAVTLFVAVLDDVAPRLYKFLLNDYNELLELDVTALLAGDAAVASHLHTESIYCVCTNGKRDPCCAKFGFAAYQALTARYGDDVWQTTHLGGHRFAPTLMAFPEGVCYGRVDVDIVPAFLETQRAGKIVLENLRGRAAYTGVVQTAEYFLRRESGVLDLAAYRHVNTVETAPGQWQVAFVGTAVHRRHTVRLREIDPLRLQASCSSDKQKTIPQFRFQAHEVNAG